MQSKYYRILTSEAEYDEEERSRKKYIENFQEIIDELYELIDRKKRYIKEFGSRSKIVDLLQEDNDAMKLQIERLEQYIAHEKEIAERRLKDLSNFKA